MKKLMIVAVLLTGCKPVVHVGDCYRLKSDDFHLVFKVTDHKGKNFLVEAWFDIDKTWSKYSGEISSFEFMEYFSKTTCPGE